MDEAIGVYTPFNLLRCVVLLFFAFELCLFGYCLCRDVFRVGLRIELLYATV